MVVHRDQAVRNANADHYNKPGYCLQQTRTWAGIPGGTATAANAWREADRRHTDRNIPLGAFVFWVGGSRGYGHIAMKVHDGIRSTDAGGAGRIDTHSLEWFDANWYSLTYVGWTDNVNGVTVPGVIDTRDGFEMADTEDLRKIVREELRNEEFISKVGDEVWRREFSATNANGTSVKKPAREYLTATWEAVKKLK